MPTPQTTFKVKGPMFDAPSQVSLGLTEAVNRGLFDLATIEGSNRIKQDLYPGHGRITGNLRNHIGASVPRDNVAQIDAGEFRLGRNLIYASWVEGISKRNRARPGFPGYQMFENAYNHINNNPKLYEEYIGDAIVEAMG
jgi:hypothetical protein